jgi:subtilisin family serine protease
MIHSEETTALLAGGTVTRSNLFFRIKPFMNRHRLGRYKLKLTASGKLTVHLWCWQSDYGFKIGTVPVNFVFVEDRNLIGDNAGAANIITVAGYDAHPRASVPIMDMSSRGPLVSYGPGPAQPAKPDIAAPGLAVDAAKSQDRLPTWPGKTFPLNGTSMSAPHVTGAVALMLSKNPALTAADAARNLRASARTAPPTTPEEAGAGRLDAKAAVDHP